MEEEFLKSKSAHKCVHKKINLDTPNGMFPGFILSIHLVSGARKMFFLKRRQFKKKSFYQTSAKQTNHIFYCQMSLEATASYWCKGHHQPNSLQSQSTAKAKTFFPVFVSSFLNSKISPSSAEAATTALAPSPSLVAFTWTLIAYIILKPLKRFRQEVGKMDGIFSELSGLKISAIQPKLKLSV